MQDIKKKIISSLFWKLMERGGNAVVSLFVQIILARLLSPEDFGLLAIIIVFVNIGAVFVQSGLNSALIQAREADERDFSTAFWLCFAIGVILYIIVFVCAPFIAEFYANDELTWPLRVIALLLIINAYNSIQVSKVTRDLELKKTFYATAVSVVVSGIVGVVCAYFGAGIWALVINQLIYQVVNCIVLAFQITWHPVFYFSPKRAKSLFKFGWKLLVSGLIDTLYQSLSSLIIGKQFSTYSLGLVSQGEKYPQALGNMLNGAIQPVMFSAISRVQDSKETVKNVTKRAFKTSAFIVVPVMGTIIVVAEPFVAIILGEQWMGVVPYLQIYCLVYALYPIQTSNLQALNGIGRSDIFLILEVVKKIFGVVILLIAAFLVQDVYAIVIGVLLTGIVSLFINTFPSKRFINYGLVEQICDLMPSVLLTMIAGVAASLFAFFPVSGVILLMLQCCVMVGTYLFAAAVLKVEELTYLSGELKSMIKK